MDLKALRHPAGGSAARELLTQGLSPQRNGAGCSHHLECLSDCCLMDLDHGGTFCAPKAGRAMTCLPQLILTVTLGGGLLVLSPFDGCGNGSKDTHYLATDQGSHQHHVPLPHGLDLHLQGPGLSPPVPFALEQDAGCHCPPPSLPWDQRPWASESCSKFSS
ncbi:colipase-like protein 2 isoform X1 [Equus przewalskii]|uniref:Colipase-like protein 2 isoform X1 n=1 Tax=Equus przewalskii TaxID=9798 RepID=A0ABM4LNS2_EQUPR